MALDAASNGNFNTRYPHQAYQLIENLASSNSTKNADLERKKLGGNMDRSQIAEVKAKLDSVHGLLVGKKSVQFAAEVEMWMKKMLISSMELGFKDRDGPINKDMVPLIISLMVLLLTRNLLNKTMR
ncbi:unnamed protein product [Microthlaspi erraticum]|uniref:Uncharacterized protein n=1 Tax=Microthlaspi erraticum TaxID=1685480 RepID=A0A6D2K6Q4_9BRAS|nr:unnamed protein product [Microthlaspi erraticum]